MYKRQHQDSDGIAQGGGHQGFRREVPRNQAAHHGHDGRQQQISLQDAEPDPSHHDAQILNTHTGDSGPGGDEVAEDEDEQKCQNCLGVSYKNTVYFIF